MEGIGHTPPMQDPIRFNQRLLAIIDAIDAGRADRGGPS